MAARTPGSSTKHLFRLATSPAKPEDVEGSLDDLVAKLRKLKEQERGTLQALQEKKEGRESHDVARTLQQRIEQVKGEINNLVHEHEKLKKESADLDVQINEVKEEFKAQKAEKALYVKHQSKIKARGRRSCLSGCGLLMNLVLVFVLALLALELFIWQTGRDDFLAEFYHAHLRALINHHWRTQGRPVLHRLLSATAVSE